MGKKLSFPWKHRKSWNFILKHFMNGYKESQVPLNPGTRIISNSFDMDEWEADDQILIEYIKKENNGVSSTSQLKKARAFYWIVSEKLKVK
jgi:hypothetical protein